MKFRSDDERWMPSLPFQRCRAPEHRADCTVFGPLGGGRKTWGRQPTESEEAELCVTEQGTLAASRGDAARHNGSGGS